MLHRLTDFPAAATDLATRARLRSIAAIARYVLLDRLVRQQDDVGLLLALGRFPSAASRRSEMLLSARMRMSANARLVVDAQAQVVQASTLVDRQHRFAADAVRLEREMGHDGWVGVDQSRRPPDLQSPPTRSVAPGTGAVVQRRPTASPFTSTAFITPSTLAISRFDGISVGCTRNRNRALPSRDGVAQCRATTMR